MAGVAEAVEGHHHQLEEEEEEVVVAARLEHLVQEEAEAEGR